MSVSDIARPSTDTAIPHLTPEALDRLLSAPGQPPLLLDLWAAGCHPCLALAPVVQRLAFYPWADLGEDVDAFSVAQRMLEQGHLMAPGRLFSGAHPSHMRFNIATLMEGDALPALARLLGR